MYYTVFITFNLISGKYYIGKHQTKYINDKYIGSGRALVNSVKIYGKDNFVKEVLYVFNNELDMNYKEKELVDENTVNDVLSYNIGLGGEGGPMFKNKKHSNKTKVKMSNSLKGKIYTEERRSKISLAHKKRYINGSGHITKYSGIRKGSTHTLETIEKIREARKKQTFSQETIEKMRKSRLKFLEKTKASG